MTFIQAASSAIQCRLNNAYTPKYAAELAYLWPRFDTWTGYGKDEEWIVLMCDHPKYPRNTWSEPPREIISIRYRLGARHQWLLKKNGKEWALRRIELLMRLLLNRLAREVERAWKDVIYLKAY